MPFNTALSGLKAASSDLKIIGNNIANASTIGFKESRAEFSDVYSSSLLGSGTTSIGSGVKLENVAQQFEQGTIGFTSNSLDVAIDGQGFFILSDDGATSYTRAGMFGLDESGFITSNSGARLQGFAANGTGTVNGVLSDIVIDTGNLAPHQTTSVDLKVNLDAESAVLAEFGTSIDTLGQQIGQARGGVALNTPSVVSTSGAPTPFDFSVNSNSAVSAASNLVPFDFSVDQPSAVTGVQAVAGHDFSVNTPSSLAATATPVAFNFSDKSVAVTAGAALTGFDFSAAGAQGSFDVTIAGGSGANGNTTATVNLTTNITDMASLLADINDDLAGVDVIAVENPVGSGTLEFQASVAGEVSTVTVNNYVAGGAGVTVADITAALGTVADGSSASGTSFDISVVGGTNDGTATINLTANITNLASLITDIQNQLTASGVGVGVRANPSNAGRLQFYSLDTGVASTVTVDNFAAGTSSTTLADLTSQLGVTDGASSAVAGAGATGVSGSLTAASFDLTIANGSGAGGNATVTVDLNQNVANGGVAALATAINAQLSAVATPGIDIRAQEDPNNAGLLQFYATVSGEASTVTASNFQVSGIAGDAVTTTAQLSGALGGITDGDTDNAGVNTAASFQVRLSGGADGTANQAQTITLNSEVNTLQDLILDIRDDLQSTGIGMDVREDPLSPGRLQFYATVSGESSTIEIDPTASLTLGTGVTQANVENALGGISMGATNLLPDPSGTTAATGNVGSLTAASFDITLSGATANNVGPITITLDSDIQDLGDLMSDIRDELRLANIGIDVREDPENAGRMQFYATTAGEASNITINNFDASNDGVTSLNLANALNISSGVTIPGISAVDNGYAQQSIDFINSGGRETVTNTITTIEGESAAQLAARFNSVPGVSASATTTAVITAADYLNNSGSLEVGVNGVALSGASLSDLADNINASASLGGISAEIDPGTGDMTVTNALGTDLVFSISGGGATDAVSVQGPTGAAVDLDLAGGDTAAAVGGTVALILAENVTMANPNPALSGLFGGVAETDFSEFTINAFDPLNQDTYNSATSVTIFDSLGNPHVMTQYFVKEPFTEGDLTAPANRWTLYVQIDGEDVGDPDVSLAPPLNTVPTMSGFNLQFDEAGQVLPFESDTIHVSNWTPLDANGDPTGALGPLNILEGATLPISDPAISSNFIIDMASSSQFGSSFAVNKVDQNGFSTGRLNGLDIATDGTIFARYSNGENQVLGQVVLANFSNNQGLTSLGGSAWAQSFESGEPLVGVAGSASLGGINSGALEESNVELSNELVQLIIAQRNFQASAKTIQTADAVTQTIINLR
jgi:flagellar hook protein FlgE